MPALRFGAPASGPALSECEQELTEEAQRRPPSAGRTWFNTDDFAFDELHGLPLPASWRTNCAWRL